MRYFSGNEEEYELDASHWTDWVGRRMSHIREVCDAVDMFIAPSMYLLRRFRDDFGIPERQLAYLDYGFHRRAYGGAKSDYRASHSRSATSAHIYRLKG